MSDVKTVERWREFCAKHGLSTNGVFVVTVQTNLTGQFCSYVVDFDAGKLRDIYPAEVLAQYSEKKIGDFIVCYKDGLDSSVCKDAPKLGDASEAAGPFCCAAIKPYRDRRLEREQLFQDFVASRGNHAEIVYELKRQVDGGALLSTTYWQLRGGQRSLVEGQFSTKVHAFKNYKCQVHGLFFGVDLYRSSGGVGSNRHHMRLNCFAKHADDVCEKFFRAAAV